MTVFHTRRDMLRLAVGAGLGLAWCASAGARRRAGAEGEIGLQAITVMNELTADLAGTLREVRRMGYRSIETVGTLGLDSAALHDRMGEAGLGTPSQHICPNDFYALMQAWSEKKMSMAAVFEQIRTVYSLDRMPVLIESAITSAKVLGQKTVVWSNLIAEDLASTAGIERIARAFMQAGETCAAEGIEFAFHNGSRGFDPVAGKRPYDILLEQTDPAVVGMQIDIYWARKVGIDPIAYIKRNPGRYRLCHLKDMDRAGEIVGIGNGIIDFREVLMTGDAAGIRHYFVEYDQAPDPLAAAADSLRRLASVRRAGA